MTATAAKDARNQAHGAWVEAKRALARHWPEYASEALLLGLFMLSACLCSVVLTPASSPLRALLPADLARRALAGVAMGATAVGLIRSRFGRRSGAHMNPAVTLTFLRLGRVAPWDACFYIASQFAGGTLGVALASRLLGARLSHASVCFAVTSPGARGPSAAFAGELVISALLMGTVLWTSNHPRFAARSAWFVAALIALFITFEAPLSGMSMNPARTFASALLAERFDGFWIYLLAPCLGMLLASEVYLRSAPGQRVYCAKLEHDSASPCLFRCRYAELGARQSAEGHTA